MKNRILPEDINDMVVETINIMEKFKLNKLHEHAIHGVMECISNANSGTILTRMGELNSLHIAAHMDIEKTTKSLNHILIYKKEVAREMLKCSDEEQINHLAELITQCDNMIKKVLGIYIP